MALYAIGDLHLSFAKDKPMDIFGDHWEDHAEKLRQGFACVRPEDTTVLCGDLSWGMGLPETLPDFRFIDALPGKKIILKGNHDYWWSTATKAKRFFADNGITSIDILHNNCFAYGDYALCGTRGWFYDEKTQSIPADYEKLVSREAARAEHSLAAGDALRGERAMPSVLFLHFPPVWGDFVCRPLLDVIRAHGVTEVYFGHIHGRYDLPPKVEFEGVSLNLISADYLNFIPQKVWQRNFPKNS